MAGDPIPTGLVESLAGRLVDAVAARLAAPNPTGDPAEVLVHVVLGELVESHALDAPAVDVLTAVSERVAAW